MAVTATVNSDWKKITGKTLSRQSALTSKMKEAVICITIGCADTYATNGFTTDLSACGRIDTVLAVDVSNVSTGLVLQYAPSACNVASTGKFKAYETAMCVDTPLDELDACSCAIQCMTFKAHVIGY